jgi:Raf kinase inhibitor-like YbhB/YbcL family protein
MTVYDPSAPTGSGWWHWTVVNIPVKTQTLPNGRGDEKSPTLPAGAVQGRNDYGYAGFGGACPPVGDKPHPYQFTVWALSTDKLPIDSNASGALVGYMLNSNVIAKASLQQPTEDKGDTVQKVQFQHKTLTAAEVRSNHLHRLHRVKLFSAAICHITQGSKVDYSGRESGCRDT